MKTAWKFLSSAKYNQQAARNAIKASLSCPAKFVKRQSRMSTNFFWMKLISVTKWESVLVQKTEIYFKLSAKFLIYFFAGNFL